MTPETVVAEVWLTDVLASTAAVTGYVGDRIYEGRAPDDAAFPFLTYQLQSALDLRVVGLDRVWADTLWAVKVTGLEASFSTLAPVADAVDDALTSATGGSVSSPSGLVLASVREESIRMSEEVSGSVFRHLGGVYRLYAQGS